MARVKRTILALMLMGATATAGAQAAADSGAGKEARPQAAPRVPLRNLNEMIELARADLAMRLGGKPTEVTLAGWKAVQLPARVLRCEVMQADAGEPLLAGYRIVLVYKARDYAYHSDTKTVTACPRIESK